MKKNLKLIIGVIALAICIAVAIFVFGGNNKDKESKVDTKNIEIVIYDKDNNSIYDEKKETSEKYLIDVLKSTDGIEVKTEDSQYGEYIVSINGLEQGDNYYWNYYVNDEYASVGASSYEVKDKDIFTFKLEKFE